MSEVEIDAKKDLTLADVEGVIRQLGEAVAQLQADTIGRQRDRGADLRYAGYVLLLQYDDPAKPGVVYTANPSRWHGKRAQDARFQARQQLSISNGIVGPRAAIASGLLDHFGELRPLLGVLSALGVLPAGLAGLVADLGVEEQTPGALLDKLLGKR